MHDRRWAAAGAALAFLAVAFGAFGAHGLRARVTPDMLAVWTTAVDYQMYHALALLLLGGIVLPPRLATAAGALFLAGIAVFSGSLYMLVLTDQRWLGAVTPIGGTCFLVGWVCVAAGALKR